MAILYYIHGYIRVYGRLNIEQINFPNSQEKMVLKKKCEEKYSPKYFPVPIQYIDTFDPFSRIHYLSIRIYRSCVRVMYLYRRISIAVNYI